MHYYRPLHRVVLAVLNGKLYIDLRDNHIASASGVGVWTKADSVTAFDNFAYGAIPAK